MLNLANTLLLLSVPVLWMGVVQLCFGLLSRWVFDDGVALFFMESAIPMIMLPLLLVALAWKRRLSMVSYRDALLFATLTWIITGILGALPIMLIVEVSFTDAVFESISALTTTGATILVGLDTMPPSFLLYRQFLQWMGGLGVVIFVVAVLPMLNVGGMRLLRAETPGPVKDDKLTPRIAHTSHYLWLVYLLITLLCVLAYYWGGMTFYDALAHSFTTVSTGGFSTHDSSMWFYESHLLLGISNVFMILGAVSFALHFGFLSTGRFKVYWHNEEARVFVLMVVFLSLGLAVWLFAQGRYGIGESVSFAFFHVVSFVTSTGFGAADLSSWPPGTDLFLVTVAYLGGCAGSTAGGNKVIRDIVAFKMFRRQIQLALHPHAVIPIHYNGAVVDNAVLNAVMAFLFFAAFNGVVFTLLLMMTGLDAWSAFTAVAACVNVLGPGFGVVSSNFQPVSDAGIWMLSAAMIIGRLEYLTVFALLLPAFWRY